MKYDVLASNLLYSILWSVKYFNSVQEVYLYVKSVHLIVNHEEL